ncbi:MAG: hypothetical protein SF339_27490 [Blastocatellia bacterium]|nr:hypothetical protein [Blastocatellia bacterium]
MKEARIYNWAMLLGMLFLLVGIALHSWLAVAIGALVAGVGGVFGVAATLK